MKLHPNPAPSLSYRVICHKWLNIFEPQLPYQLKKIIIPTAKSVFEDGRGWAEAPAAPSPPRPAFFLERRASGLSPLWSAAAALLLLGPPLILCCTAWPRWASCFAILDSALSVLQPLAKTSCNLDFQLPPTPNVNFGPFCARIYTLSPLGDISHLAGLNQAQILFWL